MRTEGQKNAGACRACVWPWDRCWIFPERLLSRGMSWPGPHCWKTLLLLKNRSKRASEESFSANQERAESGFQPLKWGWVWQEGDGGCIVTGAPTECAAGLDEGCETDDEGWIHSLGFKQMCRMRLFTEMESNRKADNFRRETQDGKHQSEILLKYHGA